MKKYGALLSVIFALLWAQISLAATLNGGSPLNGSGGGAGGGGSSIGGAVTGGTAGSVLFVTPTAIIAQDNPNFSFATVGTYTGPELKIGSTSYTNSGIRLSAAGASASNGPYIDFYRGGSLAWQWGVDSNGPGGANGLWFYSGGYRFAISSTGTSTFSPNAAAIGIVVKGAASQSSDLQEWQNSSAAVLTAINPAGIYFNNASSATVGSAVATSMVLSQGSGGNNTTPALILTGSSSDIGFSLANTGTNGRHWQFISTANASGLGAGSFGIYDLTTGTNAGIRFKIDSSGNVSMGNTNTGTYTPTFTAYAAGGTLVAQTATTGTPNPSILVTAPAHTALTASTEYSDINFNLARTAQFATGALTTQRAFLVQAPTYGFAGASTITTAATMEITGAPVAGTNATITNAYGLRVNAGQATAVPLVVKGATSQTADLQEWQVAAGTFGTWIDSGGILTVGNTYGIQTAAGNIIYLYGGTNANTGTYASGWGLGVAGRLKVGGNINSATATYQAHIVPTASTQLGLVITGAASQSVALQEWQNSSSTVLQRVGAAGGLILFPNAAQGDDTAADFRILLDGAGSKGQVIRMASGQTGNPFEIQVSAGTIASAFDVTGILQQGGGSRVSTQFDKTTSTTLSSITGLSSTLVAGKSYRFRAVLEVTASAVGGEVVDLGGGTATASAIISQVNVLANSTNVFSETSRQTSLTGASAGIAGDTSYFITMEGVITCGNAGTFIPRFAQKVSNGTSSVLVGSYMEVIQIN